MEKDNLKHKDETAAGPTRRGFLLGSLASVAGASLVGCAGFGSKSSARAERKPITEAAWGPAGGFFPMQVGVGSVEITPSKPTPLAGFALRKGGTHTGVYEPIRAKVMVLQAASTKVAFITGDLSGWPSPMIEAFRKHAADKYQLEPAQLIINASHNHEGPAMRDKEYAAEVQGKVLALLDRCFDPMNMKPARVFFGRGKCDIGVNRRLPDRFGYVNMEINKYGPVDPELLVLKVVGHDGKPLAVLTNYSCHLTSTSTFLMGSDYSGVGLRMLEDEMPGMVGLFLQGTAGDIKPNQPQKDDPLQFDRHPEDGPEAVRVLAIRYKNAVKEVLSRPMQEITGSIDCKLETVELPVMSGRLDPVGDPPYDGPTRKWVRMAKLILDSVDDKGNYKKTRPCEVYVVRIGPETGATTGSKFVLVALNGEICVPFGLRIKSQLRNNDVMVAAYTGPSIGYVLGAQEISGLGYEGRTPYSPDHEDVVCCKVMDMVLGEPPEL